MSAVYVGLFIVICSFLIYIGFFFNFKNDDHVKLNFLGDFRVASDGALFDYYYPRNNFITTKKACYTVHNFPALLGALMIVATEEGNPYYEEVSISTYDQSLCYSYDEKSFGNIQDAKLQLRLIVINPLI